MPILCLYNWIWDTIFPSHLGYLVIEKILDSPIGNEFEWPLLIFHNDMYITGYTTIHNIHVSQLQKILSYGCPPVPCCLDKRGFIVLCSNCKQLGHKTTHKCVTLFLVSEPKLCPQFPSEALLHTCLCSCSFCS